MKYKIIIVLISFCGLFSCQSTKYGVEFSPETISICTFNVEWLGDGIQDNKDRATWDYKNIAKVLSITNADIIAMQEIENEKAILKVLEYLDGYKYYVAEGYGKQNLAILYNSNIDLKVLDIYKPLIVEENRTRPGLLVYAKKGNFDFFLMNVHLKSTSSYDNTEELRQKSYELRQQQAMVMNQFLDSILTHQKDRDIIFVGDMNDNPNRKNSNIKFFADDPKVVFLTSNLRSCKNPYWDNIDHIAITSNTAQRLIKSSIRQINLYELFKQTNAQQISDHCPVVISFDIIMPDND